MSPWSWMWRERGDDLWGCEEATRESCIASAERELGPGTHYEIIEARMSEAAKHEGSDEIPLLRTRNKEARIVPEAQP